MPIIPKSGISERFTVLNQHFTYLASFSRFIKSPQTLVSQLLQLGEVLDGADHLAGVAVLVVVPGHDLHLIGVVVDLGDHGLVGIEQGAVGHADDVAGDQLLGGVAEGLIAGGLHGGVDGFLGYVLALDNRYQDGGGAGGNGHALGRADQLAVQAGDDQADGLGGAGGVRHDVGRAGTSALQVALAMGAVQDHLVAGVGVHGGHDAALDGIGVVQSLGHGRQAVGGAGSGGDDGIFGLEGIVVYVIDDGGQVVAGGGGDDDLLGAGVDVRLGLGLGGVEAGALQHDVNLQLLPGQVLRLGLGIDGDLLAVHGDGAGNLYGLAVFFKYGLLAFHGVLVFADHAAVALLSGVVLEQMSQHRGAGQVVDSNDVVALGAKHLTESQAADASKAVNCNSYHIKKPP